MERSKLPSGSLDKTLAEFYQSFVISPPIQSVFDGIDWIIRRSQFGSFVPSMLITGGTGAGKSKTIESYINDRAIGGDVLMITVRPSLLSTLTLISNNLGMSYSRRVKPSEDGMMNFLIPRLKERALKLLIIEECQHLFETLSSLERRKIGDKLKIISDQCRLPIVFVGISTAKLILEDSQWNRRIMIKRELPYMALMTGEGHNIYNNFIEGLAEKLPIPIALKITDMEIAIPLLVASKGIVGEIKEIVGYALELALTTDQKQITISDFAESFKAIYGLGMKNPFETELEKLLIPQIIEYESYLIDPDSGEIKFTQQIFENVSLNDLLR